MKYTTIQETAKRWGVTDNYIWKLCKEGRIPGVVREGNHFRVPEDIANSMKGYLSVRQIAKEWGIGIAWVSQLCKSGRVPGAKFVRDKWYIPADTQKPDDLWRPRTTGYLSIKQTAEKWGYAPEVVRRACRNGRVPGAKQIGGYWHVPETAERPVRKKRT